VHWEPTLGVKGAVRYIAEKIYRKNDISLWRYITRSIYRRDIEEKRRYPVELSLQRIAQMCDIWLRISSIYRKNKERYYTLNVWSQGKQLVLFSRES